MKKLNKKGFTLIELIVVIAILAILAAILIPAVTGYITKATDGKEQANCRSLYAQTAMELMLNSADVLADTPVYTSITLGSGATAYTASDGLSVTYTHDATDNSIIDNFVCVGTNKTFSLSDPDFAGVAN